MARFTLSEATSVRHYAGVACNSADGVLCIFVGMGKDIGGRMNSA